MSHVPLAPDRGLVQRLWHRLARKDDAAVYLWDAYGPDELATLELDLALNSHHDILALQQTRQYAAALAGALCARYAPVLRPELPRSLPRTAMERVFLVGGGAIQAAALAWGGDHAATAEPALTPGGVVFPAERVVFIDAAIGQWDELADTTKETLIGHADRSNGQALSRPELILAAAHLYREARRKRIISEEIVHLAQDPRLSIEARELLAARYTQAILADLLPGVHPAFYTKARDRRLADFGEALVGQYDSDAVDRYNFGTLKDQMLHAQIAQTVEQLAAAVPRIEQLAGAPAECA